MQIRAHDVSGEHQRIRRDRQGRFLHISGEHVLPTEVEGFLSNLDPITYPPYMFPNYYGVMEALDGQWLRERYSLSIDEQIAANLGRYENQAQLTRLSGDHRGTTLNLLVPGSSDDADQLATDVVSITNAVQRNDATDEHIGLRWVGTVPAGATVDSAKVGVYISGTGVDEPIHQLRGQASAAPLTFTTTSDSIDVRTRTTAAINWDSADLGAGENELWEWGSSVQGAGNGADLKSIIQENVDALGELTAFVMILEQHTLNALRDLTLTFYDTSSSFASKLDIDFTEAVVSSTAIRSRGFYGGGGIGRWRR